MKQELIHKFSTLLENENIAEVKDHARALIDEFENAKHQMLKAEKKKFVEEGGDPHYFEPSKDPLDSKFKELENLFIDRYNLFKEERKKIADQNFEVKLALIDELKDVNENEENIGKAFNRVNAIKKKWQETGEVPNHKKHDVRETYSKLLEEFYYHIKIFKELKDHDFKKNLEHKLDVIDRMAKLLELTSIKEIQLLLDAYLVEWDQIGPVFQKDWPETKEKFNEVHHQLQHKIAEHYKLLRDNQKHNADLKQAIIDELTPLLSNIPTEHKDWVTATEQVNKLQENYRKIGPAQRKKNDQLWDEFRGLIDKFFDAKKTFYQEKKQEFKEVRADKATIITEVKNLTPSDDTNPEMVDWKNLTQKVIQLQKDWRSAGILKQSEERKLWSEFRAACDVFFEKKKGYYGSLSGRQEENKKQKIEIIEQLENFKPTGNAEEDQELLRKLTFDFQQIGMVPIKEKNQVNNRFTKATAHVAKLLNINAQQLKTTLFKNKVDVIKTESPDANLKLKNELKFIQRKIKELEDEKLQMENNLGFFKYTPDDNPMKKDVLQKIDIVANQIEDWKNKSKTIQVALRPKKQVSEQENDSTSENTPS